MRSLALLGLVSLFGCAGNSHVSKDGEPITCEGNDIPIYSNRFAPQAGASGVATGAEAAAGQVSSDAPSSGHPVASDGDAPSTAMTVTCGQADCAPGQVAIAAPPLVGNPGTGGAPSAGGLGAASGAAGAGGAPAPPAPQLMPAGTLLCADPPPSCPTGQSPQFTSKKTWECTDCALVVTYGGIYGNYRRCVSEPHLVCPDGQVPTWVFEDEQWECKTKCDNGQYDQHTVQGVLVCVPC
jgi:hypothetical protein